MTGVDLLQAYQGKVILVTGAAGDVGGEIVRQLLAFHPRQIRLFDVHEGGIAALYRGLPVKGNVRPLIGDVRDKERLARAMEKVDVVFHCAALKYISVCEYNPYEAIKTNVLGAQNLIETAIKADVRVVVNVSTGKVVSPSCLMGATKLLSERLFSAATYGYGKQETKFCSVRLGSCIDSAGSVLDVFRQQAREKQPVTLTHPAMTRFVTTLKDAASAIISVVPVMKGCEVFIPAMPVILVKDLAEMIAEKAGVEVRVTGIRPGEKIYDEMLTSDEADHVVGYDDKMIRMVYASIPFSEVPHERTSFKLDRGLYHSEFAKVMGKGEMRGMVG